MTIASKESALFTLEATRDVYVNRGRRALLQALLRSDRATADDVRDAVELPKEVNPVLLGACPGALATAGIIHQIGFRKSTRPEAHARPVAVWELADRAKAEAWLRGHPDVPDENDVPMRQRDLFAKGAFYE